MTRQSPVQGENRELSLSDVSPALRPLLEYWDRKRGANRMPSRSNIDPLELRSLLGRVSLVRVNPTVPRFELRIVASQMGIRANGPRVGHDTSSIRPAIYRELMEQHLEHVVGTREPQLRQIALRFRDRRLEFHRLVLPLGEDHRTVDMLLLGKDADLAQWDLFFDDYEKALTAEQNA